MLVARAPFLLLEVFMKTVLAIVCAACLLGTAAQAQGVYVTPGANGPVFSDKPQSGAKPVTLQPLNVVVPPQKADTETPARAADTYPATRPEVTATEYRSFAIVSPEDGGSVAANTALFEVRLAIDPSLQLGEGHAFAVSINGQPVGMRFTATEFTIPPEFWGDTLPPANQSMQVDAYVVDRNGRVLKKAVPARFFMRYVQFHNKYPAPRPVPGTRPSTKPAPSKAPYDPRSVGESKNFTLDMP